MSSMTCRPCGVRMPAGTSHSGQGWAANWAISSFLSERRPNPVAREDQGVGEIGIGSRRGRLGGRGRDPRGREEEQEKPAAAWLLIVQPRAGAAQAWSGDEEIELAAAVYQAAGVPDQKANDPLHGITLERVVTELADHHGWEEMAREVPVRCFLFDPSVKSSLTFLRKTPWARAKVEEMYVRWKTQA